MFSSMGVCERSQTSRNQSRERKFVLLIKCFSNVSTDHITVLLDHLEASLSSRLEVRFNVPWIQVSDAHQKPRSSEGPEFTETEHLKRTKTAEFLLHHKNLQNSSFLQKCVSCFLPRWHFREWAPFLQNTWKKVTPDPQVIREERWSCTGLSGLHFPEECPL